MLKVAVPNKGTLSEPAAEMLREAGYRQRHESRDLTVLDLANDVEFFFLRPKDIAVYVGSGELDLGITGRDLAADSGAQGRPSTIGTCPTWPASGSPRHTRTWPATTSPRTASRRR